MPQPTKERIRQWQQDRIKAHRPPPDQRTIRRELGWDLVEAERKQDAKPACAERAPTPENLK